MSIKSGKRFLMITFSGLAFILTLMAAPQPTVAKTRTELRQIVEQATATYKSFVNDPNLTWIRKNLKKAKAIIIIPASYKGGFIIGAEGGNCVVLARDEKNCDWSYPAFYSMGSLSIGFQIGGKVSEIILLVMTDYGREAVLSTNFKLGADISVAAGPVGAGAEVKTVDVLAFARAKGAFGGISISGTVINSQNDWNEIYYGKKVRAIDILHDHTVSSPDAAPLVEELNKLCD